MRYVFSFLVVFCLGFFTGNYVEWKIPSKVKNIVSNVGLVLLFILMIAIVGLDIARLIG